MAAKKRRRRSSSVTVTTEDIMLTAAGAVGGMLLNKGITMAMNSLPDDNSVKGTLKQAMPIAKIALGAYLATAKGQDRKVRFLGLGIAGAGAVEAAITYLPEGYVSISGTGDLYTSLGSTSDNLMLTVGAGSDSYGGGAAGAERAMELADPGMLSIS